VLVNNGSKDGTASVIDRLSSQNRRIQTVHLAENQGYGGGILAGLHRCRGSFLGYTWGDDQISAEDHVRVFEKLKQEGLDLCKACRIQRYDGAVRKIITTIYNAVVPVLFNVSTRDVNGCPKLFRREVFQRLNIVSRDWFIDAEIMIKSGADGIRTGEVPVVFKARQHGASHVGFKTVVEFVRNLIRYRIRGAF
jgi:glycosyltransferase involved in cell wall biosynthesis